MAVNFETSTYGLLIVIMLLVVGMCCEKYEYYKNMCCKCHRNNHECICPGGPTNGSQATTEGLNGNNGLNNNNNIGEDYDYMGADTDSIGQAGVLRSGNLGGLYGTHAGDAVSEEEIYLTKYDSLAEGIDPEVQQSHNEYVVEQDIIIGSRGASGAGATEVSHYKPPNLPWGLTGFRNYYNDTYTEPDARQMPSDDPNQYFSHNPTGYCFGAS